MTARLPSLNGLRAFEAAARHLNFTRAASELNVTQTAISHQIRRLEQELGVRLFLRRNRALELTAEARDYLPGIRAAFNDLRLATDRLTRRGHDNVLTVSTLASFAAKWLLPRLSDFQDSHPGIDVRITPRARKNEVSGVRAEALLVRLVAPPVEGAANKALVSFLADELRVPRYSIQIVNGEHSRQKRIAIANVTLQFVRSKLL